MATVRTLGTVLLMIAPLPASGQVEKRVDQFTGYTYSQTKLSKLGGGGLASARVELAFQKAVPRDGPPSYHVFVHYRWSGWMFIEPGPSLLFLLDGAQLAMTSERGSRGDRDVLLGDVYEGAVYEARAADLRQLAHAKDVKVRVVGSRFNQDREFTDDTFKKLKAFVDQEVAGDTAFRDTTARIYLDKTAVPNRPARRLVDPSVDPTVVNDFEQRVRAAAESTTYVKVWEYKANQWAKRLCTMTDLRFDITSSPDSLAPLRAVVEARVTEDLLQPFETKAAADSAPRSTARQFWEPIPVRLEYAHRASRWALVTGTVKAEVRNPLAKGLLGPATRDTLWSRGKDDASWCMVYRFWGEL